MTAPTPNQMPGADQTPPSQAPPAPTPSPQEPPPAAPGNDKPKPPWGSDEEFDPQRAWNLIQNLRTENADYKTKLSDAQPVLDAAEQQRRAEQGELDTAREDLTAANSRADTWRAEAVRSKAEALAAGRFVDAEVAVTLLGDLSEYAADDRIAVDKLTARLDQLAADKPFLLTPTQPQGFTPNRGQGQSGTGPVPLDAQIKAAQDRGDMQQVIALKQQKFYQNT
ncbi:hypothetical protein OF855_24515 [Mycolicibacterium fortuitum]|uniref:hypothetical protein n=1 Tax=Mycolicibacterium fortuitum TaxID=1766 RepID=UPI0022BA2E28|nr:hypothetical protein [Mycolicibacterium fortuitum]WAY18404.1 hypothetical protein OF855_24515 [Mycolicibacterium fortuitum]